VLQEKCAYCGDMTDMPFECNYCKDPFCSEHRLPEEHRSERKDSAKKAKLFVMAERGKRTGSEEC